MCATVCVNFSNVVALFVGEALSEHHFESILDLGHAGLELLLFVSCMQMLLVVLDAFPLTLVLVDRSLYSIFHALINLVNHFAHHSFGFGIVQAPLTRGHLLETSALLGVLRKVRFSEGLEMVGDFVARQLLLHIREQFFKDELEVAVVGQYAQFFNLLLLSFLKVAHEGFLLR